MAGDLHVVWLPCPLFLSGDRVWPQRAHLSLRMSVPPLHARFQVAVGILMLRIFRSLRMPVPTLRARFQIAAGVFTPSGNHRDALRDVPAHCATT